eukprot:COSAG04_NODE_4572_length_2009_cov_1.868063_4_plen_124_part_00
MRHPCCAAPCHPHFGERWTAAAESVLVVADMGVQLSTRYRFGSQSCRFIDMADVQVRPRRAAWPCSAERRVPAQDVLVNEGIAQQCTRYYLAFVVRGEDKLVLAFQVCATVTPALPLPGQSAR